MDLSFDIRGNLKPYEKVELEFNEFKNYFFDSFEDSFTLNEILANYEQYLEDFQKEVTPNFVQWIDGSFVSNKLNPQDIDFVNLIDFDVYEANENIIESKFRLRAAKIFYKRIDAYTVKVFPKGHSKENVSQFDLVYWQNWFSETKKNRSKKTFPKGFVELKFGSKK